MVECLFREKVLVGWCPVGVTYTLDFAPASKKEFFEIQATLECGFTLKCLREMIRGYSQMHRTDK